MPPGKGFFREAELEKEVERLRLHRTLLVLGWIALSSLFTLVLATTPTVTDPHNLTASQLLSTARDVCPALWDCTLTFAWDDEQQDFRRVEIVKTQHPLEASSTPPLVLSWRPDDQRVLIASE